MLLYIQSKAYLGRTFVDLSKPSDTVARIRANLLHRLYEIGHANHQFRLSYKGVYLRDAYTLEEYKILNNAVIHMIPLSGVDEWNRDKRFHQSEKAQLKNDNEVQDIVQVALKSEIKLLDTRERVLQNYKILIMMQIILIFLSLFTNYWYYFAAYGFVVATSFLFAPTFTRVGGWVGKNSVRRIEFMAVMIGLSVLLFASSILLSTFSITELLGSAYPTTRCNDIACFLNAQDSTETGVCLAQQSRCYESSVWTAIYFMIVAVFAIANTCVSAFLLHNFKFDTGDYIEEYLIKTREFAQVLFAAKNGSVSQKRNAAFELSTMAATADDNKFQIVTEGGLDVLISLALSTDTTTQEYATEAIAECLLVPAIQDQFVSIGGMKTLTALLHTKNTRTVREAINAILYVVTDSDENKMSVINDHGLEDLAHACKHANTINRKILSSILLELAYYAETRKVMASRNTPTEGLFNLLLRSGWKKDELDEVDLETTTLTLQTLELLAIESPTLIPNQDQLLLYLLSIPSKTMDKKIQLLALKLLLYYTKSPESMEELCLTDDLTDSLLYFAHSEDSNLLMALATLSLKITEPFKSREKLRNDGFLELLSYLQNNSSERDTWNLADQSIDNLQSKVDDLDNDVKKPLVRPPSAQSSVSMTSTVSRENLDLQRYVAGSNNHEGPSTSQQVF